MSPSFSRRQHLQHLLGVGGLVLVRPFPRSGDTEPDDTAVDTTASEGTSSGTTTEGTATGGTATEGTATSGALPTITPIDGPLSSINGDFDPAGHIRFGYTIGPSQGLDPHRTSLAQDTVWFAPIYDPLIIELPNGTLVGGLAEDWAFNDDGTVLTLHLREGVICHDGEQVTAELVKQNIERAQTIEGSAVAPLLAVITSADVVDDLTVELQLSGQAATLPRILADRPGMIISPTGIADDDLANNPSGTGMYRVTEWRPGDRAVMARHEDYWNPEWPALAGLEIVLMADSATRLNALQSGQLDLVLLEPTQFDTIVGDDGYSSQAFNTVSVTYLQPNRTRSHLDDVRVRQAVMYGVDRQAIVDAVVLGYGNASPQWYDPGFEDGYVAELDDMYPYDPEKARSLIEEAGLTGEVSIEFLVPNLPSNQAIAQIAQAQLAEAGITVTFRDVDASATAATFYNDKLGDVVVGTTPGRTDPAMLAQLFVTETANSNPGGHTVPEVTAAYEAALQPLPVEERRPLLHELMTVMVEEAMVMNLFHPQALLSGSNIGGFHWSFRGQPDFRGAGVYA
ncbi:MAG: ABC transporter substrate-binding protein [Desertimonas sp.]